MCSSDLINGQKSYKADVSDFVKDLEEFYSKKTDSPDDTWFELNQYGTIELDESYDLKITGFNAAYNTESKQIEYLSFEGYLLEK